MRIVYRKVITSHSDEEVHHIMKNASSRYHFAEFADRHFQFAYPTHWHKKRGFIPVRGTIDNVNGLTEVRLEIHSGFELYIAMAFLCLSALLFVYGLFSNHTYMFAALAAAGICAAIYVIALFDGIACLDSLEHRLTRNLDKRGL